MFFSVLDLSVKSKFETFQYLMTFFHQLLNLTSDYKESIFNLQNTTIQFH